jgi:hypothetical protein
MYKEVEARLATEAGARWIWEHLRLPAASRSFDDDRAFERLPAVVEQPADDLIFFPGSDEDRVCAYRGKLSAIVQVIGDCPSFEYCLVPVGLDWMLCENHHGALMAVGEPIESRLRNLGTGSKPGG